ncbi:MAG: diaminopimelate epimerase [Bacteroidales bacterium]|nr:diaminopimelate epimerase [Bacteroidales bacterium]
MKILFSKYHGTGNDFIILDNRDGLIGLVPETIARLCDRHFGIGADGLIIIEPSDKSEVLMHYYNADGIEAGMCGNGGRCVAAWAFRNGITDKEIIVRANDGDHSAKVEETGEGLYNVELSMTNVHTYKKFEDGYFVNTGVPHFVKPVDDPELIDVVNEGRILRFDKRFMPNGVNVNFARIIAGKIKVRTYERGVEDETLSCGTGVTATAIAGMLSLGSEINEWEIQTRGGILQVYANYKNLVFSDIILKGPAQFVFEGEIIL